MSYRPISLIKHVNLIMMILTNRMINFITKDIEENQASFMPGRQMFH